MPVIMIIYPQFVATYADGIYTYGNRRFTARDGYLGIPVSYHEPVKQYAALNFTLAKIDEALEKTYINQQEYDETIAYIPV